MPALGLGRERSTRRTTTFCSLLIAGVLALTPSLAHASHLRGGYITAHITPGDHIVGSVSLTARNSSLAGTCTVGGTPTVIAWTLKAPDGTSSSISTTAPASQCLSNAWTYTGTFDVDLAATFTSHDVNGLFKLEYSLCCRVGGTVNQSGSESASLAFQTGIHRVGGTATFAPDISSNAALGIPIGYLYSQNLNVSDPNGGLTYTSLAGSGGNYATFDVVSFSNVGQVTIPSVTTGAMTNGAFYVYGVHVADTAGNYAEREVTMTATSAVPPTFSGLPSTLSLKAGETRVIEFSASSSALHALSISTSSLPSWITFSTTPGSPATGTLTISPPSNLTAQTLGLNLDAIDNTGSVALDTSANLQITVTVPPPTTSLDSHPSAIDFHATPTFTFSSPTGVSFECKIDSGGWSACSSPDQLSALGDGSHTFSARAVDSSSQVDASPPSYTWTVDSHTPAAPGLSGQPSSPTNQTAASVLITGESGATFTCTLDGGSPAACTSPFAASSLSDGAHTLSVTQTDVAGKSGPAAVVTWTVNTSIPPAPTITAQPAQHSSTSSLSFAGEGGNTFACSIDGGSYSPCTSPFLPTGLADGPHTFSVTQTNPSATTSAAAVASWTLDTTAPTAPLIIGGPVGDTLSTTATYTFSGEEGATFSCRMDGGAWAPCSPGQTYTGLSLGAHSFAVIQTDLAGNTSVPATAMFNVGVADSAPPQASTIIVANDVQATPSGFDVGCRLDHGALQSCTVRAFAVVLDGHGHAQFVLIATGKVTVVSSAGPRQSVPLTLNAAGRRLLLRSYGRLRVLITSSAMAFGSRQAFSAHTRVKIHPLTRYLLPVGGMFSTNSSRPLAAARRYLRYVIAHLSDVARIQCIGHTDSTGKAAGNNRLSSARARAICAILHRAPALRHATFLTSGRAATRPRAGNGTARGRWLNRRVEVIVTFRDTSTVGG